MNEQHIETIHQILECGDWRPEEREACTAALRALALEDKTHALESDLAASRSEVANQKVWMAQVERIAQLPASQDIVALAVKLANLRDEAERAVIVLRAFGCEPDALLAAIEASR